VAALAAAATGAAAQESPPLAGRPVPLGPDPAAQWIAARTRPRLEAQRAATLGEAVDQCVLADMARHNTPGAAVTVALDGAVVYEKGYGVKHRRNGGAVGAGTTFRIGSITKQLTAAAVMQQVEAGAVELAAPVTVWVPELSLAGAVPAAAITVRHLLTHTTGYPDNVESVTGSTADAALSAWVATQAGVRLHAPPGSFWNYSNPNFMLAGLVAERASGVPYRRLMRDRVFGPAGMTRTTFDPAQVLQWGDYTWGHYTNPQNGRETIYAPDGYDSAAAAPAGWAFSTAGDLVRWALLLTDGGSPVLARESAAAMQARQVSLDYFPGYDYGFGIFAERYKGLDLREHGGNIAGWGSMLVWVPERRFAVAVLANTFDALADAAYCIVDAALAPPDEPPVDLRTDPATWGRYEGRFSLEDTFGDAFEARVWRDGQQLWIEFSGLGPPQPTYTTEMEQAFLNTFMVDSDADGSADLDVTFIPARGVPARPIWLRNRNVVGTRRHQVRPRDLGASPLP
jgi:CubicO group peptidase (beta-lactamase class C family)